MPNASLTNPSSFIRPAVRFPLPAYPITALQPVSSRIIHARQQKTRGSNRIRQPSAQESLIYSHFTPLNTQLCLFSFPTMLPFSELLLLFYFSILPTNYPPFPPPPLVPSLLSCTSHDPNETRQL